MISACALAGAVYAGDPFLDLQMQQQRDMLMMNNVPYLPESLPVRMRVYLKDSTKTPGLDSFRLSTGKIVLWRYVKERESYLKGNKIEYGPGQIDSVVTETGYLGVPFKKRMVFLTTPGAIGYYTFGPDTVMGLPYLVRKDEGELLRPRASVIRKLVAEDAEATAWMTKYGHRFYWRGGVAALGAAIFIAGGLTLDASRYKDENGDEKGTSPTAFGLMGLGAVTFVIPLTPLLNPIWDDMPRKSLDAYNRNRPVRH